MDEVQYYECRNTACSLGTPGAPGRFTEGATQATAMAITGNPEAEYGEGICPNCIKPGKKVGMEPAPFMGEDPYQDLHDQIAEENFPKAMAALNPREEYSQDDYAADTAESQSKVEALIEAREEGGTDA